MAENDSRDVGATYLFTWNPEITPLESVENLIENINKNGPTVRKWGTGQRKNFSYGDEVFLFRQGEEPRGLVGYGKIVGGAKISLPDERESLEEGKVMLRVEVLWEKISIEPIISRSELINQIGEEKLWNAQGSGVKINPELAKRLKEWWDNTIGKINRIDAHDNIEPVILDSDLPEAVDRLGRQRFANAIGQWLSKHWIEFNKTNDYQAKSFILHLHGRWGSGKSTMLKLLQKKLEPENSKDRPHEINDLPWVIVEFNAWQHQHIQPIWWPLLDQIYKQSSNQLRVHFGNIKRWLWLSFRVLLWRSTTGSFGGGFLNLLSFALLFILGLWIILIFQPLNDFSGLPVPDRWNRVDLILGIISGIITIMVSFWVAANAFGRTLQAGSAVAALNFVKMSRDPLDRIKEHFKQLAEWINEPIIVFIDDLDRCYPEIAVGFLETIATLFNYKRVFYVVAADRQWLYTSFEKVYSDFKDDLSEPGKRLGHAFLQKIFQLSIRVPDLDEDRRRDYVRYLAARERFDDRSDDEKKRQKKELQQEIDKNFTTTLTEDDLQKIRDREGLFGSGAQPVEEINSTDTSRADLERKHLFEERIIEELSSPKRERQDQAFLSQFVQYMEPSPRALKRLVNAFAVYRLLAVELGAYDFSEPNRRRFAVWTILTLRWPQLAEYLDTHPNINKEEIPKELDNLLRSEELKKIESELGSFENLKSFRGISGF